MHTTRNHILTLISDGCFHSGTELGDQVGVSRASVAKHIEQLKMAGLDIFSVKGKGYRLSKPLTLLNLNAIKDNYLALTGQSLDACEVLSIVDSTNTYVKNNLANKPTGFCCIAEAQTAGRGRQGRKWQSPFAASLYMSVLWRFSGGYQSLAGLSLAVGVAIADVLRELNIPDVQLKWPNDIWIAGAKVGGILIEVEGAVGDEVNCILGIGLNVDLPEHLDIDQAYTSCQQHMANPLNRNALAALCLAKLHNELSQFAEGGFAPLKHRWEFYNVFAQQPITLTSSNQTTLGICEGINEQGALLVNVNGTTQAFHGGEISVRVQ